MKHERALRLASVLLIMGLWPLVFPAVTITPRLLYEFYERMLPNRVAISREWRNTHAGEAVLPHKAKVMIEMLRQNQITSFRYSETIVPRSDAALTQRLAEGAYPIRISAEATNLFLSASETPDPGCAVLTAKEGIVLARCP